MSKYKPQHSRLLFIDRKISEEKYPNCSSLAEEWEVSSKTIQRDLEYMRYQLEAPVEYSAKHRGYYYTEENFKLPAISIKESDLFAIYLAEELIVQYEGTPLYSRLKSVLQKIQDSLPDKSALEIGQQDTRFTVFPPPSTSIKQEVWDTVFTALRQSRRLRFSYKTPGKQASNRLFDPYHAIRYDGDWYIVGHCYQRKKILVFSLSRMQRVTSQKESFHLPADYDFTQITSSRFGVHWGEAEVNVTIWFSNHVAQYILERKWHPSQEISYNDDGSITLSLTVDHTVELKRWLFSWGQHARVVEPEELVSEIKEEILEMQEIYQFSYSASQQET